MYMKLFIYKLWHLIYVCDQKNSHIKDKEEFFNINIRLYMELTFLLNSEIGSFIGNLKNNTHM